MHGDCDEELRFLISQLLLRLPFPPEAKEPPVVNLQSARYCGVIVGQGKVTAGRSGSRSIHPEGAPARMDAPGHVGQRSAAGRLFVGVVQRGDVQDLPDGVGTGRMSSSALWPVGPSRSGA